VNNEQGRPSWAATSRLPPLCLQPLPRQVSLSFLILLCIYVKDLGTVRR
jgi:hypothetical protein